MNTVDDGAFDLDAALVLVRVDPRRGCAELYRLLAGEVAAYSRALGVTEVAEQVDDVLDRALGVAVDFAGHGREFRIEVLRMTTELAHGRLGDATGTELGAAVLLGVIGCSVDEAAAITGRSTAFVEISRPGPGTTRYHRRRFRVDDPPAPGRAVAAHLEPRFHHGPVGHPVETAVFSTTGLGRRPHRRRLAAACLAALVCSAGAAYIVAGAGTSSDEEHASVAATGSDVIVASIDPTPRPATNSAAAIERTDEDRIEQAADAAEPRRARWSYDLGETGSVIGTIDDTGVLEATMLPAPGWTVDVDEDTPPWIQATFTDGVRRIRFLAIADGGNVSIWVFDLDATTPDDEVAAPPATPRPSTPAPRPPTPTPTPQPPVDAPPPRPTPPDDGDPVDPTPRPTPTSPQPTPDEPETTPTPDEPDVTPTPDEPDVTPTPDEPDEPDTTPTPDEPDGERSGNSGPGRGSDPDDT